MATSAWKICLMNLFLDEWTSWMMSVCRLSRFFSRKPSRQTVQWQYLSYRTTATVRHIPRRKKNWIFSVIYMLQWNSLINLNFFSRKRWFLVNPKIPTCFFFFKIEERCVIFWDLKTKEWLGQDWTDLWSRNAPHRQSVGYQTGSRSCSSGGCSWSSVCAVNWACTTSWHRFPGRGQSLVN